MASQEQSHPRRILIVDDEEHIREVLRAYLVAEGFAVTEAATGPEALVQAVRLPPDLIILDLMLPEMDGLSVCQKIRSQSAVPIIMLTARGEEHDTLIGFTSGADDYVKKPFSPRELVMRVHAVMRRLEATSVPAMAMEGHLLFGSLDISLDRHRAELAGKDLDLTAKEFDLLVFLARHPHQVFTRQQVLDNVWGYMFDGDASTVTVHIHRLRDKIETDPAHARHLKTVWGVGYAFEP